MLTRLPWPGASAPWPGRGGAAAWTYPLVGAGLGAVQAAVFAVAVAAGLAASLAVALALAAGIVMTGALHEDGLADSADGLFGGGDAAQRLEIMADSRIGTFGALALIASVGLRWQAVSLLAADDFAVPALIAVGALSRSGMVVLWAGLPPARASGLAAAVGRPPAATAAFAAFLGGLIALGALGGAVLAAGLAVVVALVWLARVAQRRIGGQSGDILGAGQQLGETAALLVLTAGL